MQGTLQNSASSMTHALTQTLRSTERFAEGRGSRGWDTPTDSTGILSVPGRFKRAKIAWFRCDGHHVIVTARLPPSAGFTSPRGAQKPPRLPVHHSPLKERRGPGAFPWSPQRVSAFLHEWRRQTNRGSLFSGRPLDSASLNGRISRYFANRNKLGTLAAPSKPLMDS